MFCHILCDCQDLTKNMDKMLRFLKYIYSGEASTLYFINTHISIVSVLLWFSIPSMELACFCWLISTVSDFSIPLLSMLCQHLRKTAVVTIWLWNNGD